MALKRRLLLATDIPEVDQEPRNGRCERPLTQKNFKCDMDLEMGDAKEYSAHLQLIETRRKVGVQPRLQFSPLIFVPDQIGNLSQVGTSSHWHMPSRNY